VKQIGRTMKIDIADPQARVRFSLRVLLEQQGWIVGGEAADCQELFDLLHKASPDLLLVDLDLPDMPAENLLRQLRTEHPMIQIIAMSGRQELGHGAITAGADAFACKTDSPEKLLKLIRERQGRNATFLTGSSD
jgi:two-component system, NarL family, invasion response regulator UvrY